VPNAALIRINGPFQIANQHVNRAKALIMIDCNQRSIIQSFVYCADCSGDVCVTRCVRLAKRNQKRENAIRKYPEHFADVEQLRAQLRARVATGGFIVGAPFGVVEYFSLAVFGPRNQDTPNLEQQRRSRSPL